MAHRIEEGFTLNIIYLIFSWSAAFRHHCIRFRITDISRGAIIITLLLCFHHLIISKNILIDDNDTDTTASVQDFGNEK